MNAILMQNCRFSDVKLFALLIPFAPTKYINKRKKKNISVEFECFWHFLYHTNEWHAVRDDMNMFYN